MEFPIPREKRIAAAVSGGVDSMVMLDLFLRAGVKPLVVTVDHGIRGDESAEDANFVKNYAESKGLLCEVYRVDVPAEQKKTGFSTELQARKLRYEIFDRLLEEGKADVVSLAHHLSDQTETVLMRLMRGTGIRGLCGIKDREGYLHPLLKNTRAEIEEYAFRNSVPFREDKTNLWDGYFRNFVRMRVLPILKERSPKIERQVEKLTNSARETEDFIAGFLMDAEKTEYGVVFPEGVFELHDAVYKRSIVKALFGIGYKEDVEERNLNAAAELKTAPAGSREIGRGFIARREYDRLFIEKEPDPVYFEKPFSTTEIYEFGYRYSFEKTDEIVAGGTFDLNKIPAGAVVRTRKNGDRFKKFGGGDKSLSDYFTDVKFPKRDRDRALLIADGSRVYAVLGLEISEDAKCDDRTETKLKIVIERSHQ